MMNISEDAFARAIVDSLHRKTKIGDVRSLPDDSTRVIRPAFMKAFEAGVTKYFEVSKDLFSGYSRRGDNLQRTGGCEHQQPFRMQQSREHPSRQGPGSTPKTEGLTYQT